MRQTASVPLPARGISGSRALAKARARLGQRSLAAVRGGDREDKQQVTGPKTHQTGKGSHTHRDTYTTPEDRRLRVQTSPAACAGRVGKWEATTPICIVQWGWGFSLGR